MPRGTSKPAELVINELEAKKAGFQLRIENYKSKITQIDSKIQTMYESQKQKEIERVLDAIKNTGRSVDVFLTSFVESAKTSRPSI